MKNHGSVGIFFFLKNCSNLNKKTEVGRFIISRSGYGKQTNFCVCVCVCVCMCFCLNNDHVVIAGCPRQIFSKYCPCPCCRLPKTDF